MFGWLMPGPMSPGIAVLLISSLFFCSSSAAYMLNKELRFTYILFFEIEVVIACGVLLHRDKKIAKGLFELGPVQAEVEEVKHEGLYLNLVQILEKFSYAINQQCNREILVRRELVSLLVLVDEEGIHSNVGGLCNLNELLKNLSLKFKATHVTVVS